MSNESSQHLTQFQQKAQLRLQEMEVEWRRTLFERFRTICREEMMDVMKALMSNTPASTPEELNAKLEELKQSTHSNQMELFATVTQTSEEVRNLSKKLGQPEGSTEQVLQTITKGQEAISKEVTSKQEEVAKLLQEDVRQSAQLSRSTLWKAVLITAAVCILVCAGAIAALRMLSGSALVNSNELRNHNQLMTQKNALTTEVSTLQNDRAVAQKEIDGLKAQKQAMEAEMRQTVATHASLTGNINSLQQNIAQLQQLQEQFRFKLVKGETGGVFVEIPPEAQPFQYMDKTFIQVK
jgi:chromosome segregation ATPase